MTYGGFRDDGNCRAHDEYACSHCMGERARAEPVPAASVQVSGYSGYTGPVGYTKIFYLLLGRSWRHIRARLCLKNTEEHRAEGWSNYLKLKEEVESVRGAARLLGEALVRHGRLSLSHWLAGVASKVDPGMCWVRE